MKITQEIRETAKQGMEAMSKEFVDNGKEIYV